MSPSGLGATHTSVGSCPIATFAGGTISALQHIEYSLEGFTDTKNKVYSFTFENDQAASPNYVGIKVAGLFIHQSNGNTADIRFFNDGTVAVYALPNQSAQKFSYAPNTPFDVVISIDGSYNLNIAVDGNTVISGSALTVTSFSDTEFSRSLYFQANLGNPNTSTTVVITDVVVQADVDGNGVGDGCRSERQWRG